MRWNYPYLAVSICAFFMACGATKVKTKVEVQKVFVDTPVECSREFAARCADIQQVINAANLKLQAANQSSDITQRYAAQLKLNELMEIREAYRKGDGNIEVIQQRYDSLKLVIAENPGSQVETANTLTYATEELIATREVLNEYGELTLDPSMIADSAGVVAKATIYKIDDKAIPWSAYWYPKRGDDLFNGADAPLKKLDDYLKKYSISSQSVQWEKDNHDLKAAEWEGLCDAWAIASTLTVEPTSHVRVDDIDFSPSDLKALAIKYFEGYAPKIYGRRYQGSASTDGLIQDLRPEAFHKLVEKIIGEGHKPLIIDEDPGPEVWSKPLFRMSFKMTRDGQYKNAVLVQAYPWMIRQRFHVNDDVTSVLTDLAAPLYEYRLFYDPTPGADGRLKVIAGEWIGASINFHPDMVYLPSKLENQNQGNAEMKKYHEDIRKLLVKVGMLVDLP